MVGQDPQNAGFRHYECERKESPLLCFILFLVRKCSDVHFIVAQTLSGIYLGLTGKQASKYIIHSD